MTGRIGFLLQSVISLQRKMFMSLKEGKLFPKYVFLAVGVLCATKFYHVLHKSTLKSAPLSSDQGCGSAKTLPLPHRREKRNWFCCPSEKSE